jgi:hypothetical protein
MAVIIFSPMQQLTKPWFRCVGIAYTRRIKRDFQAQFASISATSKGIGQFGAVEGPVQIL